MGKNAELSSAEMQRRREEIWGTNKQSKSSNSSATKQNSTQKSVSSKTMSADTYKKYEQNYKNYKKTGSYGDTSWMKQDELDTFNNIRSGKGKSAFSNGNYYYMDNDSYDAYGKNRANWKLTGDYGDTSWMKQNDLAAYQAIRSSQDDYTNDFDDFRYSLNDDILNTVRDKWKSGYGTTYYYNMDDPEDLQRQAQGIMPKYLERQYDTSDAYGKWLYENELPYSLGGKSGFSAKYDAALDDWKASQLEQQDFVNIAEEYAKQRNEGKEADDILTSMYDSGNYNWGNFKKESTTSKNKTAEEYITGSESARKSEEKNPNQFTKADLEEYYTTKGNIEGAVDEEGNINSAEYINNVLKQVQQIDDEFDKNAVHVGGAGSQNSYKREYLSSKEFKELEKKREELLSSIGLNPITSKWDVREYASAIETEKIAQSDSFNKADWVKVNINDGNPFSGTSKFIYDTINGKDIDTYVLPVDTLAYESFFPEIKQARVMNNDEKAMFNYLTANKGTDAAMDYFNSIADSLNQRIVTNEEKDIQEIREQTGSVGSSLLGTVTQVPQAYAGMSMFLDGIFDKKTYYNDPRASLSRISSGLREEVSKDMSESEKFWYNNGTSIVDNAVRTLTMGEGGLAVMMFDVYGNKNQELLSRGCTTGQARTGAFWSAAFEGLTEYLSVDNLIGALEKSALKGAVGKSVKQTGGQVLKNAVVDILKQMGCEASEELISEVLNMTTYAVNAFGETQVQENIRLYMEQGYSEEEAKRKAFVDLAGDVGTAALGGAISGLAFGAVSGTSNYIRTNAAKSKYMQSATLNGQLNDNINTDISEDMKTVGLSAEDIGTINDFRCQPVDWVSEEGTKAFEDAVVKIHDIANKIKSNEASDNVARQESAKRLQSYFDSLTSAREKYQKAFQEGNISGMQYAIRQENKALNDYTNAKNIEDAKFEERKLKRTQQSEGYKSDLENAMGGIRAFKEQEVVFQEQKATEAVVEEESQVMADEVRKDKGLAGQVYKTDTEQAAKVRIEQKQIIDSMDTLRAEISKIAREFGIRSLNSDGRFNRAMLNLQQKMVEGQDYTEELNEVMKSVMNAQVNYTSDGQFDSDMADDIRNRLKGTFFNRIGADGNPAVSKVIFEQTRGLWRNGTGSQIDTWYDELRGQYPGLPEMQNPEDIALYLHDIKKSVGKTYDTLQNFLGAQENQTGSTASDVSSRIAQVIADYTEANIDAISDLQNTANIYNNVRTQENNVIEEIVNGQERNDISVDRQGRQYEDTAVGSDGRGFEESDTDIIRLEEGSRSVSQSHNESSREALASVQEKINESFGDNEIEEVNEIGKGTFDAIEQSKADIGNRQIRFFKYKDGDATKSRPHGVNEGNFIFVEDSGDTTVNLFNAMHEVMHDKVQAKYADVVINAENGQAVLDSYRQHTGKDGTDAEVLEELICDIYGNLSVMQTLNKKIEPSVFVDADMESAFNELQMQVMMSMLEGENAVESEDEEVNRKNAIQPNFSTTDASKYTEIDPENSAYYQAIADGDEETQAEMVREAAKENGYVYETYHGTSRGDRVGRTFLKSRATSGPMAYFTSNKDIAENYARNKTDTSIAYDDAHADYHKQFRVNIDGKDVPVSELWRKMSYAEKQKFNETAKHITLDLDGNGEIVYDENAKSGLGNYDEYTLREYKQNGIDALIGSWLDDGNLLGEEERFLDVLEKLGIENVKYNNPNERNEKVFHTYLKILHPFNTENVTKSFIDGYLEYADKNGFNGIDDSYSNAYAWDKRGFSPELVAENLKYDLNNGTTFTWISVPDSLTSYLESLGYDGIIDKGGKYQKETEHTVYIPFYEEQVKSADNIAYDENGKVIPLNERFNSGTNDIYFSTTTFLTPEQEEQRYIQQRTNQARTNAERTIENKRQANQVYEEVVMGTEYGFTPDDIIKKVAERMYGNKNKADIQQVLSMTERMLLRNGYNVGGKFADNKMADIAADSLLWQKLKAAAGQSPLRIFQDVAAYRDTKLADQEARTKAIIQNAKSSQEFSDDYFMYKEQQLMKKNRYMIEASKVVDSIDANDTESILAQMLGEGLIGKEQMQNAVSDGKHVFIPVLDGAIVTDKKGRIRWMADGESLVTYSDNYYQKLTKLRAEIDNIRKNNPDNADVLIAEAKKKSGLPLETPGAYKSVKTADGWKLVDALGETIVSVNGKKKFSADKVTSLVDSLSKIYAEMYDDVQGSLVTNGYAPIGKLERYFPHFTKQRDGFAGFMDYLHSEDLPIDIAGLTETFKPGKPWARNLLERLGDRTDYDAVHGFNGYLNSVTDVIYLTPVIQRFRQLENTLRTGSVDADEYGTNQNNSNFVVWLHDYTNQLANKKHSLDRGAETMAGRKVYTAMSKIMGATGKSAIAFNFRTGLSNFASFAQGAGIINPKYTARAVSDVIQKVDDGLDESIPFVYNRVNQADELTTGTRSKIASKAQYYGFLWMKICDDFSTKAIARAKYYELIDKGYSNERAINETSKWCTNLFADRSKGSRATIFTSKMLSPLTQFQLEPYNQLWHYTDIHNATVREQAMKAIEDNNGQIEGIDFNAIADMFTKQSIAKKDIEKYLGRFLSTTLYGMLMRLVTGRDVTWNLGGMVADVIGGAKKNGAEGAVDALKDDILDNIPFSSVVEKLINITNGDYTATNNPITASVSNIVNSAKGFAQGAESGDVLKMIESGTYYMPGGSQLRKSMGGIDAFNKGGAYTAKGDKLRYPIEQNVPNFVKAVLFGKGSFQPRNYDYSTDLLGTEETKAYRQLVDNGVDPQEAYDFLLNDYSTYARQDESTTQAAILASGLDERTQDLIAQALGIELGTEEEVRQDLADFDAETEKKHGSGKIKDSTYEKRKTAIDYYMEMLY